MVILESLYGNNRKIPRLNILDWNYEDDKNFYFRCLSASGFNIPLV